MPSPEATEVGERFDPAAATEAYLARVPAEQRARSDSYFEGGYWLQLWDFLLDLGAALLLLATGLSAKIRDLAERKIRWRSGQTLVYASAYLLFMAMVRFPMSVYEGFVREHHYGLSNQTFDSWLGDQGNGVLIALALGVPGLTILYALLRRTGRLWWIWGSALSVGFVMFAVLIGPVLIEPVFNHYTPLKDPSLRETVLSMARANGIPAGDVYQFDASRQSKRISANVSGLFGTMRIALNDNLLNRCSRAEIEEVMGHEMGHYVLHHAYHAILFLGAEIVLGFAFLRWAFDRVRSRWGRSFGIREPADVAGLPLLGALLATYFFCFTPINNSYSRALEAEADLFGLNASRHPDATAEVALKLGEYRKLAPSPLEEWLFFDHPSGRTRILTAMRWKAEHRSEPPPSPSAR